MKHSIFLWLALAGLAFGQYETIQMVPAEQICLKETNNVIGLTYPNWSPTNVQAFATQVVAHINGVSNLARTAYTNGQALDDRFAAHTNGSQVRPHTNFVLKTGDEMYDELTVGVGVNGGVILGPAPAAMGCPGLMVTSAAGWGGIYSDATGPGLWFDDKTTGTNFWWWVNNSGYMDGQGSALTNFHIFGYIPVSDSTYSYIHGLNVDYCNSTSIYVLPGEGWCGTDYMRVSVTNLVFLTVTADSDDGTAIGTAFSKRWIYVDNSGSTFPSTLDIYHSSNAPILSMDYQQWVHSTASQDRCIGFVMSTVGEAAVWPFTTGPKNEDNEYYFANSNTVPYLSRYIVSPYSDTWRRPQTNTSYYLGAMASHALVRMYSIEAGGYANVAATTPSMTTTLGQATVTATTNWFANAAMVSGHGSPAAHGEGWVTLDDSKDICVFVDADDATNYWQVLFAGWRIQR